MNEAKFPRRNDDGSFCIEIGLKVASYGVGDLRTRVQTWIAGDWMPRNRVWKREWKTGADLAITREQLLNYEAEFEDAPKVVSCDLSGLRIKIAGRASARFWRDWLISKFLPDLRSAFPEIDGQLYVRDFKK